MKKLSILIIFSMAVLFCKAQDSVKYTTRVTVTPCKIDTIKGILYYHSKAHNSYGNEYGEGYWVGKCGPHAIMGLYHYFVPGQMKFTIGSKEDHEKNYTWRESVRQNGQFYNYEWKKIKAEDVYALIVDNPRSEDATIEPLQEQLKAKQKGF